MLATVKKGKPELRKKGKNFNPLTFDLQESAIESACAVDLDFDYCGVGLLKRSCCAVKYMRASLNQLLN